MDNQLGLDFFCKYANVGTISANLFILLNIIIKLNRIDYIKRKVLFVQIIFSISSISSLYYFNIKSELEKAKTLFMVSDNYSVEEIKKIRNRLIKSFHPDGNEFDDEYAKKINNAYDVLIKNKKGV